MPSFSLATYTIRVRYKGKRQTEVLGAFGEEEHDLLPILDGYLTELQAEASLDEDNKKKLQVDTINLDENEREITGNIRYGYWGVAAPGMDFETGELHYERSVRDVEPYPFYYLLSVPEDGRIGFAITQRFGTLGIRGQLLDYFQRRFNDDHPEFRINIETAAPADLIEQYTQQGALVKKIRFIQFRLPRNFEDRYANPQDAIKEAYSEFTIHAKRGGLPILRDIRAAIQGRGIARLVEIAPGQTNKVHVDIEVDGKVRSLEVSETTSMRAYYDITKHAVLGDDGFPTFDSANELAHGLLARQYQDIGQ